MQIKQISKLLGVMSIAAITGFSAPAVIAHPGHSPHHHIVTRNSPKSDWHHEKLHKRKKHGDKYHHDRGHRHKHHKHHHTKRHHHSKKHHRHGYRHRYIPRYADHYRDGIVIKLYKHF